MRATDVWFEKNVTGSESGKRALAKTGDDSDAIGNISFEFERHWTTGADVTKMLTEWVQKSFILRAN
jgi:hypothetical protein